MIASNSLFVLFFFFGVAWNTASASDPRRSVLARAHHRHARALASQQSSTNPVAAVQPVVPVANSDSLPIQKRQLVRRCKPKPSNSTAGSPSSPSGSDTTALPAAQSPAPAAVSPAASPAPSTQAAAPPPSNTPAPVVPSVALPSPTPISSSSGPSFLTGTQTGQGTFYEVAGAAVACGQTFSDSDAIAAVSHLLFDAFPGATANPNNNPVCGRTVTANWQGGSVTVKIVDRCTGCALTDLDFSPSAFGKLTNGGFSIGRISGMTWTWD